MWEREKIKTIENEKGYLTYKEFPTDENPQEYRIFDLYVLPKFRKSGVASSLANQVVSIARAKGCKIITGSVDCSANGKTESTKVLLAYGFSILRVDGNMIYFLKEVS